MKKFWGKMKKIVTLLLLIFSTDSFSSNMLAICSQLEGARIDYFTNNSINKKNNTFLVSTDKSSGSELRVLWKENSKDAIVTLSDTSESPLPQTHFAKAVSVFSSSDQISFVGMLNKAPIMVTLYPNSNVAVYSEQSTIWWALASGARAKLFHAVCEIKKID